MEIPALKRIKINSEQDLRNWVSKNQTHPDRVMLTTITNAQGAKFVSNKQVDAILAEYGWAAGPRFTLNGGLLGHVAQKA